jgi:hypothetical protein
MLLTNYLRILPFPAVLIHINAKAILDRDALVNGKQTSLTPVGLLLQHSYKFFAHNS